MRNSGPPAPPDQARHLHPCVRSSSPGCANGSAVMGSLTATICPAVGTAVTLVAGLSVGMPAPAPGRYGPEPGRRSLSLPPDRPAGSGQVLVAPWHLGPDELQGARRAELVEL